MKQAILTFTLLLAGMCIANGQRLSYQSPSKEENVEQAEQYLQSQQIAFEENKGQVTGEDAQRVKYTYKDKGLSIFLLNNGIAYQFSKTDYPEGYKHLDKFANNMYL